MICGAQRSIDIPSRPRITYVPQFGELRLRDESGRAPYPDIFRDHLEILVALAVLNQDKNVRK